MKLLGYPLVQRPSKFGKKNVARIRTSPSEARQIRLGTIKGNDLERYIRLFDELYANRYFLNGNWRVDLYGDITFAGANWQYKRETLHSELLKTEGPTDEEIVVEVSFRISYFCVIAMRISTIFVTF